MTLSISATSCSLPINTLHKNFNSSDKSLNNSDFIIDNIDVSSDATSIFDNPDHLRIYAESCIREVGEDLSRKGIDVQELRCSNVPEKATLEDLQVFLKSFKSNSKFDDETLANNIQVIKNLFNKYVDKDQMDNVSEIFDFGLDKIKFKKDLTQITSYNFYKQLFYTDNEFGTFQDEIPSTGESTELLFNNYLVSVQNNDLINAGQENFDYTKNEMIAPTIFSLKDYKMFRATDICQKLSGGLLQIQIDEDTANKVIDISNIDINAEFDSFLKAKGCKNEEELNYLNGLRQKIGVYDDRNFELLNMNSLKNYITNAIQNIPFLSDVGLNMRFNSTLDNVKFSDLKNLANTFFSKDVNSINEKVLAIKDLYENMINYEDLDAQTLDNIKDGIKYINFFVDNLLATTDTETEANIMRLWDKERYTSDENSWRTQLHAYSYLSNNQLQKINAKKSYDNI